MSSSTFIDPYTLIVSFDLKHYDGYTDQIVTYDILPERTLDYIQLLGLSTSGKITGNIDLAQITVGISLSDSLDTTQRKACQLTVDTNDIPNNIYYMSSSTSWKLPPTIPDDVSYGSRTIFISTNWGQGYEGRMGGTLLIKFLSPYSTSKSIFHIK